MRKLKLKRDTVAVLDSRELRLVAGGITVTDGACLTRNVACTWQDCPTVTFCN